MKRRPTLPCLVPVPAPPPSEDDIPTLVDAPRDPVMAKLDAIEARLNKQPDSAAMSAELTMTRKAARWRGVIAALATAAGIAYASFTAAVERSAAEHEDRVDAIERKVDRLADTVDELVQALDPKR